METHTDRHESPEKISLNMGSFNNQVLGLRPSIVLAQTASDTSEALEFLPDAPVRSGRERLGSASGNAGPPSPPAGPRSFSCPPQPRLFPGSIQNHS